MSECMLKLNLDSANVRMLLYVYVCLLDIILFKNCVVKCIVQLASQMLFMGYAGVFIYRVGRSIKRTNVFSKKYPPGESYMFICAAFY